ncbi:solute carrier family facilitated glucose transporter member 1-like [Brachionus plicatilis]|uniref:Solute carrier family facilitated glucose transporter member 1-like n=1 Tax=Brachionus plicatilis TaxID=10195 RepID=A0A3M7QFQ1_BRAPC|nr:solute carrier family facilitated glucose transporter member 1-like [Brachionus plicatilis]
MSHKLDLLNSEKIKQFELERIETLPTGYEREPKKGVLTKYLMLSLLVAAFGSAFQFGFSIAIFNTPSDVIQSFYREVYSDRNGESMPNSTLNTYWSITNGLVPFGGMVGGMFSGFTGDLLGRKNGLLSVNAIVLISTILNVISKYIQSYETIMVSRFLTGIYCGLFSGLLPLYLSECPPKNLRGSVGTLNQLSIVTGILVVNILGLPELLGKADRWPILVGLSLVPALVHILLVIFPESPKFLYMKKNDVSGAEKSLVKFRNHDRVLIDEELEELKEEKAKTADNPHAAWSDFWTIERLRKPLFVALMIQVSQQFSGINAVIFYSTGIFKNAGLEGEWPIYGTIILGAVQIAMTFVCMAIVDRAGRRILLLTGMIGMCISSFMLALTRIFSDKVEWLNYMTVVSAVFYIIFFSIGPGAIPWLITGELFGSDSRGKATSIAVFVNWLSNFIVTVTFPFIETAIGSYSFIVFGVLLIFFSLFMLFFVPETKHKPIEEINDMFKRKTIFFPSSK